MAAKLCEKCEPIQNRLLDSGDSSRVICDHMNLLDDDDDLYIDSDVETYECSEATDSEYREATGSKRKRTSFIMYTEFDKAVSKKKKNNDKQRVHTMKWRLLPLETIFKVENVKVVKVTNKEGERSISRIGEFLNEKGELITVWLPNFVGKELANISDFNKERVFIRSNGLKWNKKSTHQYFDFDIVRK